jgi:hypothetical protein
MSVSPSNKIIHSSLVLILHNWCFGMQTKTGENSQSLQIEQSLEKY